MFLMGGKELRFSVFGSHTQSVPPSRWPRPQNDSPGPGSYAARSGSLQTTKPSFSSKGMGGFASRVRIEWVSCRLCLWRLTVSLSTRQRDFHGLDNRNWVLVSCMYVYVCLECSYLCHPIRSLWAAVGSDWSSVQLQLHTQSVCCRIPDSRDCLP